MVGFVESQGTWSPLGTLIQPMDVTFVIWCLATACDVTCPEKETNIHRQKDGNNTRKKDISTDGQTDRQAGRQTDRQTDREVRERER